MRLAGLLLVLLPSVVFAAPLTFLQSAGTDCATEMFNINYGTCWQVYAPIKHDVTISHLCYNVGQADATGGDVSDLGLIGPDCASGAAGCPLVADIGPTAMPSTGSQCTALRQGPVTLKAGRYWELECNAANNTGLTKAEFLSCTTGKARFGFRNTSNAGVSTDESAAGQIHSTVKAGTQTPGVFGDYEMALIGGY